MEEKRRAAELGIGVQYAHARRKKRKYLLVVICMVVLPAVGYIFDIVLAGFDPEEVRWIPINLGIYAIMGLCACYVVVLVVASLVVFIKSLQSGGLIVAIFTTILVYGVGGTLFVGGAMLLEKMTPYAWFGTYELLQKEIGGPGEIFGVALIANIVFGSSLFFGFIKLIDWGLRCRKLKSSAAEMQML